MPQSVYDVFYTGSGYYTGSADTDEPHVSKQIDTSFCTDAEIKQAGVSMPVITSVFVFLHTGHVVQESDPSDR